MKWRRQYPIATGLIKGLLWGAIIFPILRLGGYDYISAVTAVTVIGLVMGLCFALFNLWAAKRGRR